MRRASFDTRHIGNRCCSQPPSAKLLAQVEPHSVDVCVFSNYLESAASSSHRQRVSTWVPRQQAFHTVSLGRVMHFSKQPSSRTIRLQQTNIFKNNSHAGGNLYSCTIPACHEKLVDDLDGCMKQGTASAISCDHQVQAVSAIVRQVRLPCL